MPPSRAVRACASHEDTQAVSDSHPRSTQEGSHRLEALPLAKVAHLPQARHHAADCADEVALTLKACVGSNGARQSRFPPSDPGVTHPLRPSGLPIRSDTHHGLTESNDPPHSAQRNRAESCARVRPSETRGRKLIGRNLITRHRGQWHSTCV